MELNSIFLCLGWIGNHQKDPTNPKVDHHLLCFMAITWKPIPKFWNPLVMAMKLKSGDGHDQSWSQSESNCQSNPGPEHKYILISSIFIHICLGCISAIEDKTSADMYLYVQYCSRKIQVVIQNWWDFMRFHRGTSMVSGETTLFIWPRVLSLDVNPTGLLCHSVPCHCSMFLSI